MTILTGIATIVNRFVQNVCGLQTVVLWTSSKAAHNMDLVLLAS